MKKSILEKLSPQEIESITKKIAKKKDIPLVKSKQINMRLSPDIMARAKKLALLEGRPVTSYLASLLKQDIERLWPTVKNKIIKKAA
jgi:predicted DNA binding CopG/RHH family protein